MPDTDLFGLKGVHVVITGASGGIGVATLKLFDKLGAHISAHANTNSEVLEELGKTTQSPLNIISADVTKEEEVHRFYEAAIAVHGPPAVLIGIMLERLD
jgi:NAD(P)-dependent dehydrogenase (short-subunit alcohol dehydrogenase family)